MERPNQTLQNIDQTVKKINFLWDKFSDVAQENAEFAAKKMQSELSQDVEELRSELKKAQEDIAKSVDNVENYITNLTPEKAKHDLEKLNTQVNKEIKDFRNRLDSTIKEEQTKMQVENWSQSAKEKFYESNQKLKASLQNLSDSFKSMEDAVETQIKNWQNNTDNA